VLYLHETVDVRPEYVDEYGPKVAELYRPAMEEAGARLVALWETVPFSLPWPQFITLWEVDGIASVNSVFRAQYADRRDSFTAWRRELGRLCTRSEGRMLTPSAGTCTLQTLQEHGPSLTSCVHEWITVHENMGEQYCKQLEHLYAPNAGIFNREFVGTYHEVWRNKEVVNLWALPDEFTVFPGGEIKANNLAASNEIESWIVMSAGSLRESFRSGLLRQVTI
jgi:hypothetical protein